MDKTLMVTGSGLNIQFRIENIIQLPVFTWEEERRLSMMNTKGAVDTLIQDQGQEHAVDLVQDRTIEV